jgi:hypothetical protein
LIFGLRGKTLQRKPIQAKKTLCRIKIRLIGISIDVKCTPFKNALIKDQLFWPNECNCRGWDESCNLYEVKSVSKTFFIGPDERILAKNIKPNDFEWVELVLSRH